jgi:hypothetical protein
LFGKLEPGPTARRIVIGTAFGHLDALGRTPVTEIDQPHAALLSRIAESFDVDCRVPTRMFASTLSMRPIAAAHYRTCPRKGEGQAARPRSAKKNGPAYAIHAGPNRLQFSVYDSGFWRWRVGIGLI